MKHPASQSKGTQATTRPRIQIPPIAPATPEEIARRRALREEARRIRERIGPVGVNAVDLIDLDFYDTCDSE